MGTGYNDEVDDRTDEVEEVAVGKRDPVSGADAERGRTLAEWRLGYPQQYEPIVEWDDDLGVPVPTNRRAGVTFCGAKIVRTGEACSWSAGAGTAHLGVGACVRHDTQVERAAGAWIVAHAIARIGDISPWEALLLAVKRAAAWAAFYDTKLAAVESDDDLAPSGSAHHWVVAAERVNDKLARYSKMAVDAGVAAMLVTRARAEGEQIAAVLNTAIGAAGLDAETETRLRAALRHALLAVDEPVGVTIDGEATEN